VLSPAGRDVVERSTIAHDPTATQTTQDASLQSLLRGHVLDPLGNAVGDADVRVSFRPAQGLDVLDAEYARLQLQAGATRTDAGGTFELGVPAARDLILDVRAAGFGPAHVERVFSGDEIEVRLKSAARASGSVLLGTLPLSDVPILVRDRQTLALLGRAVTDPRGMYSIDDLPPGLATLHAIPDQAVIPTPALIELNAGESVLHDFILEPGVMIRGRVVDATDHHPLAGASVATDWIAGKSVMTDAQGAYRLPGFAGKRLHARATGYCGGIHRFEQPATEDAVIDFELDHGRTALGRIVSVEGSPIPGVYVAMVSDNAGPEHKSKDWRSAISDENGRFRVGGLDRGGDHAALFQSPGRATLVYDLPSNEHASEEVDLGEIVMSSAGAIAGRANDARGAPLSGIRVRLIGTNPDRGMFWPGKGPGHVSALLERRESQSDPNGRFYFADLALGHYDLETVVAFGTQPETTGVDVTAGPSATPVRLVLAAGDAIEGRVESPEGNGLSSVLLQALPEDEEVDPTSTPVHVASGPDGRFVLRGLQNETYQIVADPGPLNRLVEDRYLKATLLDVSAGDRNVRFVLQHAALLAGRVTTSDGQPARGARVSAYVDGAAVDSAASDSLGNFKLSVPRGSKARIAAEWGPPPGQQTVHRAMLDDIESGRTNVPLRLDP
jgi:hypothetical protein